MYTRNEYPRPQLKRENWLSLNGEWQFAFGEDINFSAAFKGALPRKITVPFSYQYPMSGIGDEAYHETVYYKRTFDIPAEYAKKRAVINFNAVDYRCEVYVNGNFVVSHEGGYSPFKADVTKFLKKSNEIFVKCVDPLDPFIPRGKQSWLNERFGCWYVPNTGIWQSVWLDFYDGDYLDCHTLTTDIDACSFGGEIVTLSGKADECRMTLYYKDKVVKKQIFSLEGRHTIYNVRMTEMDFVDESFWWTPENPNLFYLDIELLMGGKVCDLVHTRFGMRKISVEGGRILLNNRPYYQRLILDQGYFKESGITPPSAESLKEDILAAKKMGYNGARKHQKFEDPYFYYYAEEIGFLTWCEMPSSYNFNVEEMRATINEWQEIVDAAKNFTSVICYVPVNESWGVRKILNDVDQQNYARALYYITKSRDAGRLVSVNDGWENLSETDVTTIHDYSFSGDGFKEKYDRQKINETFIHDRKIIAFGNEYKGQPVIFSEFGGIAMNKDAVDGKWGYNSAAASDDEFYARYKNLFEGVAKCDFNGFCYTQLTDVQQEVNGLLKEDRTEKFDPEIIRQLTMVVKNRGE